MPTFSFFLLLMFLSFSFCKVFKSAASFLTHCNSTPRIITPDIAPINSCNNSCKVLKISPIILYVGTYNAEVFKIIATFGA